jgi:hypothetical protein
LEPCLGLEFDEVEDACICYNAYARKKGFSIRKNHTRLSKGDDKLLIGVDYSCSREGFRHKSYQKKIHINLEPAETRVGCKAMMGIKKVGDSIFIGYILVKTKILYVMVAGQSVFPNFMYLTVDFQIGIFIHRDIYCSQASRRYP